MSGHQFTMEVNREHFRAMMFYDFKVGLTKVQSLERLRNAFGNDSPSRATVYRWFREFQNGRGSLEDEGRIGRPVTAATDENVHVVKQMLMADNRTTYAQIQARLGIGAAAVRTILYDKLGIRKLYSCWTPHHLIDQQKQARVRWCREMLQRFKEGHSEAIFNILTTDESWIYQYKDYPETKQQATMWVFGDENLPVKIKGNQRIEKKLICSYFCASGHIETMIVEDQSTMIAEWYRILCSTQILDKLRKKQPETSLKEIILHHGNTSVYTTEKTANLLKEPGIQIIDHPPYSPDLAPCDFFIFPKAKESIRGQHFESLETAVAAYKEFLSKIPKQEWREGFHSWFDRMRSCIQREGDYCEKIYCDFSVDLNQSDTTSVMEEVKNKKIDIQEQSRNYTNTCMDNAYENRNVYDENKDENKIGEEQVNENKNVTLAGKFEVVTIKMEKDYDNEQDPFEPVTQSNPKTVSITSTKLTSPQPIKVQSDSNIKGMSEIRIRSLKMLRNLIQTPQSIQKQIYDDNVSNHPTLTTIKTREKSNLSDGTQLYSKPACSYACLIAMALKNSPSGTLTISEICNFICQHFPYFNTIDNNWKSTVRLSMKKYFIKCSGIKKQQGGCRWAIDPLKIEKVNEELQKWTKRNSMATKQAMKYPDYLELLEKGKMKYLPSPCSRNVLERAENPTDEVSTQKVHVEATQDCTTAHFVNSSNDDIGVKDNKDELHKQLNISKNDSFDSELNSPTKKQKTIASTVQKKYAYQLKPMVPRKAPLLLRTSISNCSFINID